MTWDVSWAFTLCRDVSETRNQTEASCFSAGLLPLHLGEKWISGCAVQPPGRSFSRLKAISLDWGLVWIWWLARGNASCTSISVAFSHWLLQAWGPKAPRTVVGEGGDQSVPMYVSLIFGAEMVLPLSPSVLVWGERPLKELVFSILSIMACKSGWVIKCQLTVNIKLLGSRGEI